jgi:hypothetical protein
MADAAKESAGCLCERSETAAFSVFPEGEVFAAAIIR